jgi:hypothetical protein
MCTLNPVQKKQIQVKLSKKKFEYEIIKYIREEQEISCNEVNIYIYIYIYI